MSWAWPLAPLLVLPLLALVLWRERVLGGSDAGRRLRLSLRLVILGSIAAALGQPSVTWRESVREHWVVGLSRAASWTPSGRAEAALALEEIAAQARDSRARFSVLEEREDQPLWLERPPAWLSLPAEPPPSPALPEPQGPSATLPRAHVSPLLLAARAAFARGERGRLVLLLSPETDVKDLGAWAAELGAAGVSVQARVLPERPPPSGARVRIAHLRLPTEPLLGSLEAGAELEWERDGEVQAVLWVDGSARLRRSASREPGGPSRAVLRFDPLELPPGRHHVALTLGPAGEEQPRAAAEALAQGEVLVVERPRVLLAVADAERSLARRAASAQGFSVEVIAPRTLAERVQPGQRGAHVLVADAAALAALSGEGWLALRTQVRAGLGLYVEPGLDLEAWAALGRADVAEALPLAPLAELPPAPPPRPAPPPPTPPGPPNPPPEQRPTPGPGLVAEREPEEAFPISLLLVLDRSASMRGGRWRMAVEAAVRAAAVLSPYDRVGVITFAEAARVDLAMGAMGPAGAAGSLALHLPQEAEGTGTNLVAALQLAAEVLRPERSPIRHVLLLTDGFHNPTGRRTESAIWSDLVRPLDALGATFTAVGLSPEHDERTLKEMVKWARRGRYEAALELSSVPTVLVRDTVTVARQRSDKARAAERQRPRLADPSPPPSPATSPPRPPDGEPSAQPPGTSAEPSAPPPTPVEPLRRARVKDLHPAVRGFPEGQWPEVGRPRRSGPRAGSTVVLEREGGRNGGQVGDPNGGETILAARRYGLGRVLAFAARPADPGWEAWPGLPRLLGQALASLAAPPGTLDDAVHLTVLALPEGDRLLVRAAADAAWGPLEVRWTGGGAERSLGRSESLGSESLALPEWSPGAPAHVAVFAPDGRPVASRTYLAGLARRPPDAARVRDHVERALQGVRVAPVSPPTHDVSLVAWFIGLALVLLPLDAWLHRRRARGI